MLILGVAEELLQTVGNRTVSRHLNYCIRMITKVFLSDFKYIYISYLIYMCFMFLIKCFEYLAAVVLRVGHV